MWFVLSSLSINLFPLLKIPLKSPWKEPWNQESKEIDGEINKISHSQNPPKPKPCLVLQMHKNCNSFSIYAYLNTSEFQQHVTFINGSNLNVCIWWQNDVDPHIMYPINIHKDPSHCINQRHQSSHRR